jgi:hypothetical protein
MSVRQGFAEIHPLQFVEDGPPPVTPVWEKDSGLLREYWPLHSLAIYIKNTVWQPQEGEALEQTTEDYDFELPTERDEESLFKNSAYSGALRLSLSLQAWFKNQSDLGSLSPSSEEANQWLKNSDRLTFIEPLQRHGRDSGASAEIASMLNEFPAFAYLRATTELELSEAGFDYLKVSGEVRGILLGSMAIRGAVRDAELSALEAMAVEL